MKPIRVVLDTNVYIAAALNPQSILYRIIEDSAAQHFANYFTSPEILAELQNKLENKFGFNRRKVVAWISELEHSISVIRPSEKLQIIKDDPDDDKILECAMEIKADLIISADRHLLKIKQFRDTKIMHTSSLKYIFPQIKREEP